MLFGVVWTSDLFKIYKSMFFHSCGAANLYMIIAGENVGNLNQFCYHIFHIFWPTSTNHKYIHIFRHFSQNDTWSTTTNWTIPVKIAKYDESLHEYVLLNKISRNNEGLEANLRE